MLKGALDGRMLGRCQRQVKALRCSNGRDDMSSVMKSYLSILVLVSLIVVLSAVCGQSPPSVQKTERPTPPARDPRSPGYVVAKELPDGANLPADGDGNFIIGPTHDIAPEIPAARGIPKGAVI